MNHKFELILDEDEHIIKVYKPNNPKFIIEWLLVLMFAWALVFFVILLTYITPEDPAEKAPIWAFFAALGIEGITVLIFLLFNQISYRKRFYAYTNKNIIIQKGFIGKTFKILNHEVIGMTEVKVDFLDKLLRQNTGTINFGSVVSHYNPRMSRGSFHFIGIPNPYEAYQEIKNQIDKVQGNN